MSKDRVETRKESPRGFEKPVLVDAYPFFKLSSALLKRPA